MKTIEERSFTGSEEKGELLKQPREVVLHFIRHGEAEYQNDGDHDGHLTELGRSQAARAASTLCTSLREESVVAFYTSPRTRAIQTTEIIESELQRLNVIENKNIVFHKLTPQIVKKVGMDDALTATALAMEESGLNAVDEWLQNPNEMAAKIERDFLSFAHKFSGLAKRVSTNGPDIHIIVVSHSGPSEYFASTLRGSVPRSKLGNCEGFEIRISSSNEIPTLLIYKGETSEIDV